MLNISPRDPARYFLGYEFDAILTLTSAFETLKKSLVQKNCSSEFSIDSVWRQTCWRRELLRIIQNLDIQGVTGRVRFSNGDRIGEIVIEQILGRIEFLSFLCQLVIQDI